RPAAAAPASSGRRFEGRVSTIQTAGARRTRPPSVSTAMPGARWWWRSRRSTPGPEQQYPCTALQRSAVKFAGESRPSLPIAAISCRHRHQKAASEVTSSDLRLETRVLPPERQRNVRAEHALPAPVGVELERPRLEQIGQ